MGDTASTTSRAPALAAKRSAGAGVTDHGSRFTVHRSRLAAHASRIGVFDSGVGGLSVVRELIAQLPSHPIVYLADQAHAPYGQRSLDEIRDFAAGITRFLLAQGSQVIVIACNTASAAALHWLRQEMPTVPFVGMEPAVKPAAERTRTGHIGVIATAATFQGELFASLLDRFADQVVVHPQACPDLVPLVEAGELDTERARAAVQRYLAPLLAAGVDQLVLGCTHYPFLRPVIQEVAGPGVQIIDPAPAVARQVGRVLAKQGWPADQDQTGHSLLRQRFYTTASPMRFRATLRRLLDVSGVVKAAAWDADGRLDNG